MSDHALLGWLLAFVVVITILGFGWMFVMFRESRRHTRALAGMVYQENEKTRAAFFGRPPLDD